MTEEPSFDAACAEVPALLDQEESSFGPGEAEALLRLVKSGPLCFHVTGIGGSESPARCVALGLASRGFWAEYRPLSAFLDDASERNAGHVGRLARALIVVSQGLSPNAQFAIGERANYAVTILVTARSAEGSEAQRTAAKLAEAGVVVVSTNVPNEPQALVRMAGPACLAAAGERCVRELMRPLKPETEQNANLGSVYAAAFERALPLATRCARGRALSAVVVTEPLGELIQADLWKWREALGEEPPPVFDGFSFVHGPLQTLPESAGPVLIVSRESRVLRALSDRLKSCIAGSRHDSVEFELASARELAWFEINALFSQWILVQARERRRNLSEWRGGAADKPIYALNSRRSLETA